VLVWSLKYSSYLGSYCSWMGDCLGTLGAVGFFLLFLSPSKAEIKLTTHWSPITLLIALLWLDFD
jgi:hypothetical protein